LDGNSSAKAKATGLVFCANLMVVLSDFMLFALLIKPTFTDKQKLLDVCRIMYRKS
jgi:hypothetical protein